MTTKLAAVHTVAIALAMTSSACAQSQNRPAAAEIAVSTAPAAPTAPAASTVAQSLVAPDAPSGAEVDKAATILRAKGPVVVGGFGRSAPNEAPQLLVTSPMEPAARAEMIEDLNVMQKLLRDAMGRERGDEAMGIKLYTVERATPMYVEDSAVIFRMAVDFPLAGSGASPTTKGSPTSQVSAWDRAKRDIERNKSGNRNWQPPKGFTGWAAAAPEPAAYDAAKVDALVDAIVRTLPEASHFRHLKDDESVFVTVAGVDDAGAGRRLTLKAKKADINAVAAKTISADEFKRRVSRAISAETYASDAPFFIH